MIAAYKLVIFLFLHAKLEAQVWAKAGQGPHQGKQQQMLNDKKKNSGHSVCGCAGIWSRTNGLPAVSKTQITADRHSGPAGGHSGKASAGPPVEATAWDTLFTTNRTL